MKSAVILCVVLFLSICSQAVAKDVSDFLILNDIGNYKFVTQEKRSYDGKIMNFPGYREVQGSGYLIKYGHFSINNDEVTYITTYFNWVEDCYAEVKLTIHSGDEVDQWLRHEMETGFRFGDYLERISNSNFININGNYLYYSEVAGYNYSWLSNNNIYIYISSGDLFHESPAPIDVINSYLQKFPSILQPITIDDSYNNQWINNEFEHLLWLCNKRKTLKGKYDDQLIMKKIALRLDDFLEMREHYYSIPYEEDEDQIQRILLKHDINSLFALVDKYTQWWAANKPK